MSQTSILTFPKYFVLKRVRKRGKRAFNICLLSHERDACTRLGLEVLRSGQMLHQPAVEAWPNSYYDQREVIVKTVRIRSAKLII